MERQEFQMGMGMLSMTGLPKITEEQLEVWFRLLQDLKTGEFEEAVMYICNRVTQFYPGTNVPALIRERVEEDRIAKKSKALKESEKQKEAIADKEKRLIEAEYEEDPIAFQNRRKIRTLAAGVGRKM